MRSFYSVLCRWSDEIRPFTVESEVPETPAQVRAIISQFATGQELFRVYRIDADECFCTEVTDEFLPEQEPFIPSTYDMARDEYETQIAAK